MFETGGLFASVPWTKRGLVVSLVVICQALVVQRCVLQRPAAGEIESRLAQAAPHGQCDAGCGRHRRKGLGEQSGVRCARSPLTIRFSTVLFAQCSSAVRLIIHRRSATGGSTCSGPQATRACYRPRVNPLFCLTRDVWLIRDTD